ncbi:hypothetical protein SAMN05216359_12517 [Roseateles sp. YR242]|uniref:hypothetical protein n=1 Tax=Roseateles sp. YR242 TaxID=1855305 RepID=UPI0008CA4EB7|nr:hypothetical protein [Roseateles sp. YR242]SEL92014.1 hypothetical protein SAMN05216359_12517 [Roseateles sp. YR242]
MKKSLPGDIYSFAPAGVERYFQFLGTDPYQLNSEVIAVFEGGPQDEKVEAVVGLPVSFYTHVSLPLGIKMKCWEKVGHAPPLPLSGVLFRDTNDCGDPEIKVSNNWWVWTVDTKPKEIGALVGTYRSAYVGLVRPPTDVVARLKTGAYQHFYPEPAGDGPCNV